MGNVKPNPRETRPKPGRADAWLRAHGGEPQKHWPEKPATIPRRKLVKQGRRLVICDLGHDGPDDQALAHEHQEKFLGAPLKVQFHTWFKIVAQRAHDGWDVAGRQRISNAVRELRLSIARDTRPDPAGTTGADPLTLRDRKLRPDNAWGQATALASRWTRGES
jgi:hypothetical protein